MATTFSFGGIESNTSNISFTFGSTSATTLVGETQDQSKHTENMVDDQSPATQLQVFSKGIGQDLPNVHFTVGKCQGKVNATIYFNSRFFSDVKLDVNDGLQTYNAHKLVLSTRSRFFQTMFKEEWKDPEEQIAKLEIEEDYVDVFHDFLFFLYGGDVSFNKCKAVLFYGLADKYDVPDLMELCEQFFDKYLQEGGMGFKLEDAVNMYDAVIFANNPKIRKVVANYLLRNIKDVTDDYWLTLSKDVVCGILGADKSPVTEFQLFE